MTIDFARGAGAGLRMARTVFFGASLFAATIAATPTPPPGSPAGTAAPGTPNAAAGAAPVHFGTAEPYAVLAGKAVTSTGESVVQGDLGIFPGTALAGFPPGTVNGAVRPGGPEAQRAQADLTTAYEAAIGRSPTASVGAELAGQTLAPGVYRTPQNVTINGTLTLDARNDPLAVFVFQLGAALTTSENSRVQVINSPQPLCHVVWAVGNSATLAPGTQFVGRLVTTNSATVRFASTVADGGVLSRGGEVHLDSAVVRRAECARPTPPAPAAPPSPGATPPSPGATPRSPGATPRSPGATPRSPGATPSRSSATPSRSSATPSRSSARPSRPGATPPTPSFTSPAPGVTPPAPGATPPAPGITPPAPGVTPPPPPPPPPGATPPAGR